MVLSKSITKLVGEQLLSKVFTDPTKSPKDTARELGLLDVVSDAEISGIITETLKSKPDLKSDYIARPEKVLPFIIGQVMKATKGRAKSDDAMRIIQDIFSQ